MCLFDRHLREAETWRDLVFIAYRDKHILLKRQPEFSLKPMHIHYLMQKFCMDPAGSLIRFSWQIHKTICPISRQYLLQKLRSRVQGCQRPSGTCFWWWRIWLSRSNGYRGHRSWLPICAALAAYPFTSSSWSFSGSFSHLYVSEFSSATDASGT